MKRFKKGIVAMITAATLVISCVPVYAANTTDILSDDIARNEIIEPNADVSTEDIVVDETVSDISGDFVEVFDPDYGTPDPGAESIGMVSDLSDAIEPDSAVIWPTPAENWYEDYDYTVNEDEGTLELNKYKEGLTAEYLVIPASVTLNKDTANAKTYSVVLDCKDPDGYRYSSLWSKSGTSIKGIKIGPGVKAKRCDYLFCNLYNITDIDISGLNTAGITDFSGMFSSCSKLENLNISGLDTASATNMSYMFSGEFTSLDLTGIATSNVTDMSGMFEGCKKVTSIDLSGFDTSKVTGMSHMFDKCESLETINFGKNFVTSNVTNMYDMFQDCSALKTLDLTGFDTKKVESMNNMFCRCSSLGNLDFSSFELPELTSISYAFYDCDSMTKICFDKDLRSSKLSDMGNMFGSCKKLREVDLSGFDTSNVTDMSWMFEYNDNLRKIVFGEKFITSNVTDMKGMFYQCFKLDTLDVSGFDTSKVENMDSMFESCSHLTVLDVSGFNTSRVTNMDDMFYDCSGLLTLDVSNFDTSKVTNFEEMFRDCRRLRTLNLGSFNTENGKNFYQLLFDCSDLTVADLRSFDFSNGVCTDTYASGTQILYSFIGGSGIEALYLPVKAMSGFDFVSDLGMEHKEGEPYTLQKIFYAGTEEQWKALGNTIPEGILMHYEWTSPAVSIVKERVPITSVTPAQTELSLNPGKYKWIKCEILPENATDRQVHWISEDPEIAYVAYDDGSIYAGSNPGTTNIKVIAADGSGASANIKVTVTTEEIKPDPVKPDPVKPNPVKPEPAVFVPTSGSGEATDPQLTVTEDTTSLTLVKGQKFTLGNTDWKSDNSKIVAVSKGNVTAKAATGDKPVTLSRGSDDNKQSISVTVLAPTIDKADKTITLVVGESKKLNLKNTGDLAVTYTSATPDVATVYSDGTVIGISKGSSAVTAYVNGVAFKFTVKVIDANTKVNFADETVTLVPNQTLAIKVPGFTASKASWTSDTKVDTDEKNIVYRDSVVKIDKSGRMTAIGVGSTSFTGTDSKSNSVNIKVSVSAPAEHVIHLNVNTSKALKLFGVKGNLVWGEYKEGEVEVPEVLTATTGNGSGIMEFGDKIVKYQSGKFTGLKAGMVTLKANDGNFDHILKIYVEDPSVKGIDGKPFNYSVNMKVGETKNFTLSSVYQDVTFISNKPGVAYACPADVDGSISYVISARSAGTAKLTAKVNGKAVSITVKVTK